MLAATETMKYKSFTTELILALLIALPAFIVLITSFFTFAKNNFEIASIESLGIYSIIYFLIIILIWRNTYYEVGIDYLRIKEFGLFTKVVAIEQIFKITKVNEKPATSTQPKMNIGGFIIMTKRGEKIFVSPIKENSFLNDLKRLNPMIKYDAAANNS